MVFTIVNQDKHQWLQNILHSFNADANSTKFGLVANFRLKDLHVDEPQAWTVSLARRSPNIAKKVLGMLKVNTNAKANAPIVDTTYNHIYTTMLKVITRWVRALQNQRWFVVR